MKSYLALRTLCAAPKEPGGTAVDRDEGRVRATAAAEARWEGPPRPHFTAAKKGADHAAFLAAAFFFFSLPPTPAKRLRERTGNSSIHPPSVSCRHASTFFLPLPPCLPPPPPPHGEW